MREKGVRENKLRPTWAAGCLILALLGLPGAGEAQNRGREIGLDGAISFTSREGMGAVPSSPIQAWAFPLQRVRIGQPLGQRFQLQISSAFSVADFGDISTVRFSLGLSGNYRVTGKGERSGLFLSLGSGMDLLSHQGTDVQWTGVAGLGMRLPVGDRFAFRPAFEVSHSPRSSRRFAANAFTGLLGFSVFTQGAG